MAKEGIDERMKQQARSVAANGPRVVVFNPLPYERDAEVEVEMPEGYAIPGGAREGGKVRFLAKGVPAGGYKTFGAKMAEVEETASVQQQGGGVSVSRKGVRVTAFCPNPDGDGIVLRMWEQAGVGGTLAVTLPKGMKVEKAQPVNLRGEIVGGPIAVEDGKFSFDLGAWVPKSFIFPESAE